MALGSEPFSRQKQPHYPSQKPDPARQNSLLLLQPLCKVQLSDRKAAEEPVSCNWDRVMTEVQLVLLCLRQSSVAGSICLLSPCVQLPVDKLKSDISKQIKPSIRSFCYSYQATMEEAERFIWFHAALPQARPSIICSCM